MHVCCLTYQTYHIPPIMASNPIKPPTTPPTIGAILEDEFDPLAPLVFKEGGGELVTFDTKVDDGGEVDVTMTSVVTTLPFGKVVVAEEDMSVNWDMESGIDEEVGAAGVGVEREDWEVEVLLMDVELELQDVENRVRVGFDDVNVTGTVTVTGTETIDVEAGEHVSYESKSYELDCAPAPVTTTCVGEHEELAVACEQTLDVVVTRLGGKVVTVVENDVESELEVAVTTWNCVSVAIVAHDMTNSGDSP